MKSVENIVGEMLLANITSHEYFFDRHPELTQERKALHQGIIEGTLSRKDYSRNKRVYMLGGAPANGKSRLLKSGFLPHPEDALRVDVDEIKLELPEYRYMIGTREPKAAVTVHDESSNIGYEIRQAALRMGFDLVWDGTADESLEHRKEVAAEFKAYGHYSRVDYVTLDLSLSLELAEQRYQRTGRRVPAEFIKEKCRDIANLVPEIIAHKVFDELYLWDTNIANHPRLILSQKNGKLEIEDDQLYKNFKMKGHVKGNSQNQGRPNQGRKKAHRF